jgi:hypothetical protein
VKTTKPTGDAECPPHVERAHEIEYLMNEKVGCRDLDDTEIADAEVDGNLPVIDIISSDEEEVKPSGPIVHPIARRLASDRLDPPVRKHRTSKSAGQDLLAHISKSLDPALQSARSDERSVHTLHTTQLFNTSTQLRDSHATVERLQQELHNMGRELQAAERRADRAELLGMVQGPSHWSRGNGRSHSRSESQHKFRQDICYPDGGGAVRWISPSNDSDYFGDSPGVSRHVSPFHSPSELKSTARTSQMKPVSLNVTVDLHRPPTVAGLETVPPSNMEVDNEIPEAAKVSDLEEEAAAVVL